jgi:ubiquinone/menaquinone biosynthesis C-methylase UbiE
MEISTPSAYDAWYHTRRGIWMGNTEFQLLKKLLHVSAGNSLLDVGCGTGYFTRRFSAIGLEVSGVDTDIDMLRFARTQSSTIEYYQGSAVQLPFADNSYDYVSAITSLCFVEQPTTAITEMLRVCRKTMLLGLLNRHSLLYREKYRKGSYRGARWDSMATAKNWITNQKTIHNIRSGSCLFFPGGHVAARAMEFILPR